MGIRYVNVGSAAVAGAGSFRFDLLVTNRTAYTPSNSSSNGLSGRFAQINFAANSQVRLRVQVYRSCCEDPC